MEEFKYLGSVVDIRGGVMKEVEDRIARAFLIIKQETQTSPSTQRELCTKWLSLEYCCMSETWTTKQAVARKLEAFNNRY